MRRPFKSLERFEEAKSLLRKTMPVARRVLGESHELTLKMRWIYAAALYRDDGATLDDLRGGGVFSTLEQIEKWNRDRAPAFSDGARPAHRRDGARIGRGRCCKRHERSALGDALRGGGDAGAGDA